MVCVNLLPQRLHPNAERVVVRAYPLPPKGRAIDPSVDARARRIVETVRNMDNRTIQAELSFVLSDFETRHRKVREYFEARYDSIARDLGLTAATREAERALIGAYFCHEYSYQAAALMNPSVVPHPDQTGLNPGELRFLMSLRAVGEGHISSITFREGVLSADCDMRLVEPSEFAVAARPHEITEERISLIRESDGPMNETVLFPVTQAQRGGLEDLRLVQFHDGENQFYCGTYTAWSGHDIASELMVTHDFHQFELRRMSGPASRDKGMALFPRRIGGQYVMIGRQDRENIFLIRSDDLTHWGEGEKLAGPRFPWELIQIGNCGAPIELEQGWLLLTHGVGAMRKYCIGAMLLDRQDPSRVLGRSQVPLLSPSDAGREGYVPNVVYTCGALVHGEHLFVPFGIADSSIGFATIRVDDLLASLV
jgi:predicted GH43/DUF377 family glycosyl hydrolase